MISLVYQTLIISGIIIFIVLFYFRHMAKNFLRVLTEIIKMNELNEYDPVKFIENLPPLMTKLGVKDYSYYIYFLDTEYSRVSNHGKSSIKKFVYAQDFTVYVEISPGKLRLERAYLGILLVETIFLLLKIDVNLNLRSTNKALMEFSKINTFLSHDIKNLAQFINIMEHNLGKASTEAQQIKLFDYLKETAPSLKLRADRVLMSLSESAKDYLPDKKECDPYEIANNIANILNVKIEYSGERHKYLLEKKGLIIIFENIVKNFYDKSINEPGIKLTMEVSDHDGIIDIRLTDNGSHIKNPEKIFEPFYSEKSGGSELGFTIAEI